MIDRFGRPTTGLRISVTQRCNLNCFFCHREWNIPQDKEVSRDEIRRVVEMGKNFGIEEVKITGGEPLVRQDIVDVVKDVSAIVDVVSLTTNGILLETLAKDMKEAGLRRVNVNLPSLVQKKYQRICGADLLAQALGGIGAAVRFGLMPVKINMVLLRNTNENEVGDIIDFGASLGATVQLIEMQPLPSNAALFESYHADMDPIEAMISRKFKEAIRSDDTRRRKYVISSNGCSASIEVVRPLTNPEFCKGCTRMRVTSDGRLKPCLLRNDNLVDFVGLLRANATQETLARSYVEAVRRREPYWGVKH